MSNLNVPDKFYCYENYIGISGSSAFFSGDADVITTDARESVISSGFFKVGPLNIFF